MAASTESSRRNSTSAVTSAAAIPFFYDCHLFFLLLLPLLYKVQVFPSIESSYTFPSSLTVLQETTQKKADTPCK